jgi:hypothetical protein
MSPDIVQYVIFIIAALILSWGVIELNKRYFGRRNIDVGSLNTWVNLDTRKADEAEDPPPDDGAGEEEEDDEKAESGIQTRAKQNGHHSESKNLL